MFSSEETKARLRERPFRPLRIIASEGQQFEVLHPDLVMVGRRDLMIGLARSDRSSIYDRVTRLALVHVVALEDLPVATPGPGNGQLGATA